MNWLSIAALYVAANFLLYTLLLRRFRLFARESLIFLYQFVSFLALPILLATGGPSTPHPFAAFVAALALHGVYSLSFLELWALSEGSYSLGMLDRIEAAGALDSSTNVDDLEEIGSSKKSARLESLEKLGLIRSKNGSYLLSPWGRVGAPVLRLLVWIVNIKERVG